MIEVYNCLLLHVRIWQFSVQRSRFAGHMISRSKEIKYALMCISTVCTFISVFQVGPLCWMLCTGNLSSWCLMQTRMILKVWRLRSRWVSCLCCLHKQSFCNDMHTWHEKLMPWSILPSWYVKCNGMMGSVGVVHIRTALHCTSLGCQAKDDEIRRNQREVDQLMEKEKVLRQEDAELRRIKVT